MTTKIRPRIFREVFDTDTDKVSEAFSDRKFYLKHKLSTASLQSSTGML